MDRIANIFSYLEHILGYLRVEVRLKCAVSVIGVDAVVSKF